MQEIAKRVVMSQAFKIKRALISVSDKNGLGELATELVNHGVEIISSSGTGHLLNSLGINFTPIEKVTGNPEAFSGRMKTLSFEVSSALLFKRDSSDDVKQAKDLGITPIDLVVCNLYPFEEVSKTSEDLETLIENIDIGGPCMIRAAAKNFNSVVTLSSPYQYSALLSELRDNDGGTSLSFRKFCSAAAFAHTANYESVITEKLNPLLTDEESSLISFRGESQKLRYGENPHQSAHFLGNTMLWSPLQGKELSYNNILDADAAYRCLADLNDKFSSKLSCVIVKHSNPCGACVGTDSLEVLKTAWSSDPISSFGGILCFNHPVGKDIVNWLSDKFVELVIAPDFTSEALELLRNKKNLRVLKRAINTEHYNEKVVRSVTGGILIQDEDRNFSSDIKCVTLNKDLDLELVSFGAIVTKHFRSNAISLVEKKNGQFTLIGAGMGNPNRLISTTQALDKAKENGVSSFDDAVLVSDAFFPFRDNVDLASSYGIKTIVQPGGSIKDKEVISACDENSMVMAFTGIRHFRH